MKNLLKKIIIILIAIPVIIYFIPIKISKNSSDAEKYYIIDFISEGSTDGGTCRVWGNQDGMFNDDDVFCVTPTGKDMRKEISSSIYNNYTKFIVYGNITEKPVKIGNYEYTEHILNIDGWDFYGEIKGGSHKHYMTIYDKIDWSDY